jgi:hypothetical protein
MDPEVYLGTLLQRAPDQRFRYAPGSGRRPSELLAAADPNPYAPGVNSFAALPTYPRANYLTSNSLFAARPGEPVWHSIDAMSPYQNSLRPPAAAAPPDTVAGGRAVFGRAGCRACHDGPALSNNRVLPAGEIGTEPTRARAFAKTEPTLAPPQMFAPDVPTPPPPGARLLDVPMSEDDVAQARLAWAHGGSAGGYKVPNLIGLAWTAPYLHDGGVAAGADPGHVGVESTLRAGIPPDPANSLRALLDRELRARVVAANKQSAAAVVSHVTGEGHAFWVDDAAGFTPADRDALVAYLLSRDRPE